MSSSKYLLVSLPNSISPENNSDAALKSLRTTLSTASVDTHAFTVPTFKIGTLDALVSQADELTKLASDAEGVVGKVGDSLRGLLEGDEEKVGQQRVVGDSESCHVLCPLRLVSGRHVRQDAGCEVSLRRSVVVMAVERANEHIWAC